MGGALQTIDWSCHSRTQIGVDSWNQKKTVRVVTRASDGSLRTKDFDDFDQIMELHDQIGIDDCSTDLSLRGMPLFRGLVGPLAEGENDRPVRISRCF